MYELAHPLIRLVSIVTPADNVKIKLDSMIQPSELTQPKLKDLFALKMSCKRQVIGSLVY